MSNGVYTDGFFWIKKNHMVTVVDFAHMFDDMWCGTAVCVCMCLTCA